MDKSNIEIPDVFLRGTVQYDGGHFAGWQIQYQGETTVQGALQEAMSRIAGREIAVQGAGRTDSGVHSLGQTFSCTWPGQPPARLRHALSRILGPEIRVSALEVAPEGFSARYWAKSKRYTYSLDLGREPNPFTVRYAWHVHHDVDLEVVRRLLDAIVGTRDFAGFQSAGSQMKTTVRTVYSAKLVPGALFGPTDGADRSYPELMRIEYHGNAFLYKMIRNLTGTMIEVARGRFPESFFYECLASPGPFLGHCAPAHGLALVSVDYGAAQGPSESEGE